MIWTKTDEAIASSASAVATAVMICGYLWLNDKQMDYSLEKSMAECSQ